MTTFYSKFIQSTRKDQKMSITDLAKKSGVPFSTLQKIESKGCIPRVDTLEKILDALGFELVFFERTEAPELFEKK